MLLQDNIIYTHKRNLTAVSKSLLGNLFFCSFSTSNKNIFEVKLGTAVPKNFTVVNIVTKISFAKRFSGSKKGVQHAAKTLSKDSPVIFPNKPSGNVNISSPVTSNTSLNPVSTPKVNPGAVMPPIATTKLSFNSMANKVLNPEGKTSNININYFQKNPNAGIIPPPPPPLPPKPLCNNTLVTPNNSSGSSQLEKIIEAQKNLKAFSGKTFSTNITTNTTPNTISDTDLISELKKRELIKIDTGQQTGHFLDNTNNIVSVGHTKFGIKLNSLGQAYANKQEVDIPSTNSFININNTAINKFMVVIPPKPSDKTFVESGDQKHLLVNCNKETNEYYAIGYFTSKISGKYISDLQYKTFENLKENLVNETIKENIVSTTVKLQKFTEFYTLKRVQPEDITPVKYSQEYLDYIKQNSLFENLVKKLAGKAYKDFNTNGLTKENALDLCKEHDNYLDSKKKHPVTDDQIKLQELNKAKQQKENALKQEENQKLKALAKEKGLKKQQDMKLNKVNNDNETI